MHVGDLGNSVGDEVHTAAGDQVPFGATHTQEGPGLEVDRRDAGPDESLELLRSRQPFEAGVGIGKLGRMQPGHLDLLELAPPAATLNLVPEGLGREDDKGSIDPTEQGLRRAGEGGTERNGGKGKDPVHNGCEAYEALPVAHHEQSAPLADRRAVERSVDRSVNEDAGPGKLPRLVEPGLVSLCDPADPKLAHPSSPCSSHEQRSAIVDAMRLSLTRYSGLVRPIPGGDTSGRRGAQGLLSASRGNSPHRPGFDTGVGTGASSPRRACRGSGACDPRRRLAVEDRLLFLIGSPRSGSTLLARMLGAHSQILGVPEPHLLTPLAFLGYFDRVEKAPYDPVISQEAIQEVVLRLPEGEKDYIAACRAYADSVYEGLLATHPEKSILIDKTPAYALALPFIAQLYPKARYVALTRNPLAILSSYAESFFDGSYEEALRFNPILDRYVPAIARFLRERRVPLVHVRYEQLVEHPAVELEKISDLLEIPFEEGMVEYGGDAVAAAAAQASHRGLGDPTGVGRHTRPVTDSVEKWAREIASDPRKRALAATVMDGLDSHDVETWGYTKERILQTLESAGGATAPKRAPLSRYRLERRVLVRVRRLVRRSGVLTRLLQRLRLYCDVLLR